MSKTKIPWAEHTWNPMTGCTPVSSGCDHCYARRLVEVRLNGRGRYSNGFTPTFHPEALEEPLKRAKPTLYFINSMSDTFHERFMLGEIQAVFDVMRRCPQHRFLVLTKRAWRMHDTINAEYILPLPNVMFGVTVEGPDEIVRIHQLKETRVQHRFVSIEPFLRSFMLPEEHGLDWVIIGGESGRDARPCDSAWVHALVEQCRATNTPVFVKQAGANPVGKGWDELLKIREWPRITGNNKE